MNFFRNEAVDNKNDAGYGDIIILASFGLSFSVITTIGLVIFIFIFLCFGQYTRKTHLSGIVMPSTGLIKITPQYPGYVTGLTVSEGQHVVAGTPLYHISGERYNGQGTGTLAAMILSLKTQYLMLALQQTLELRDNNQQQQATRQRISSLLPQIKSAEERLTHAEHQALLSASVLSRYRKLVSTICG